uniref:MARVEL domain-containing protein n=1 Tax=Rhizochromulina marina TaxID=1034831 RepID=A0A7S2S5Q3_9STRA
MADSPAWLASESAPADGPRQVSGAGGGAAQGTLSRTDPEDTTEWGPTVRVGFRCFHLGAATMMLAAAAVSFTLGNGPEFSEASVALYTFLFGLIFGIFELTRIYPISFTEIYFLNNFGFLFTHSLKAIFIIFVSFAVLGLNGKKNNDVEIWPQVSTCIVVCGDGFALLVATFYCPQWFPSERPEIIDPTKPGANKV